MSGVSVRDAALCRYMATDTYTLASAMAIEKQRQTRLLLVVNTPEFFLSHRLPVALGAKEAGFEVNVATGPGSGSEQIRAYGIEHHWIPMTRSGKNPFRNLATLVALIRLYRQLKPTIVHLVTIKPVLLGGLAARVARVPAVVAAVSGLGSMFVARGDRFSPLRIVIARLYRAAVGWGRVRLIVQNPSDRETVLRLSGLPKNRSILVPGSGVDLSEYLHCPEDPGIPIVTFASRLLKDKGIKDFIQAALLLKQQGVKAIFWVVGAPDCGNPTSVTPEDVAAWRKLGYVDFLGHRNDIAALYARSHIVCLPSYYGEGIPKALIEAAAVGRAVVTTDLPGCRDAVEPGITGLLVPSRDPVALAAALRELVENSNRRRDMGIAGRRLAERRFGVKQVVEAHLTLYDKLLTEICLSSQTQRIQ